MLMAQAGVDVNQMLGQISNGGGAPTKPQGLRDDGAKAGVVNG